MFKGITDHPNLIKVTVHWSLRKDQGQKKFVPVDSSCLLYGKKWFQRVNTKTYVGGIESPLANF